MKLVGCYHNVVFAPLGNADRFAQQPDDFIRSQSLFEVSSSRADPDYARTTRWGGVIAPQDFNPFTWPIDRPRPATRVTPLGGPGLASMNGGMKDTYGVPMRPGDVITSRARLADFEERRGRLGLTIYVHNELEWTNQTGQLVRRRILTVLRYRADRIP